MTAPKTPGGGVHWSRAWGGFVFGSIAVTALALIAFVLSAPSRHSSQAGGPLLLTPLPSSASGSPSHRPSPSHAPSRTRSASRTPSSSASSAHAVVHPLPTTRPVAPPSTVSRSAPPPPAPTGPCTGAQPCVVGGSGALAAALDRYRRAHGAAGGVSVVVSSAAQQCATTAGDGPSCAQPYAVAYEPQQDGARAVADIGAGAGNWLLDPGASGVEVGWAYQPRTGQYVCALLERT